MLLIGTYLILNLLHYLYKSHFHYVKISLKEASRQKKSESNYLLSNYHGKVKTLWEGHKIWKKSPTFFDKTAIITQQSYEIKSPSWTILWFRILGIFSENIDRLGVFMFQTWDNSQLSVADYCLKFETPKHPTCLYFQRGKGPPSNQA